MEEGQFQKIQGWFETLDRKIEIIRSDMVTKQQFENRFQALFTAMSNLHNRVESYKDQTDHEISLVKRALHDLEEEVKTLHQRVFGS